MRLLNSICKVLADKFTETSYREATVKPTDNPKLLGLYELNGSGVYVATQDTAVVEGKTYYTQLITKTPVYIEQVPNDFVRPSFLVEAVTNSAEIKNYNIYQKNPLFQIVYFGERDIANQVLAEPLYRISDMLDELFLLQLAIPVITDSGEKQRYAKIVSFVHNLRLEEGAIYCNLTISFTETVPHNEEYEVMENLSLGVETVTED